ncbi:hypothetical protein D918_10021 [Trichuris suis]|nr:hypothetical protein D918_10021 [Trichuris suis]
MIENMLTGGSTVVELSSRRSAPSQSAVALSKAIQSPPLLFNLVLDELFERLDQHADLGYCWKGSMSVPAEDGQGGRGLTALGFADDVAIIAKSALGLNLLLRRCSDFLATRHLRLNPKKCAALLLSPAPKTTTPIVGPETHRLPILSPEDSYRYLGFNVSPTATAGSDPSPIFQLLAQIEKAHLRPQQKIALVRENVFPRCVYVLSFFNPNSAVIKEIDAKI